MAVKLRLRRMGRKKRPFYRIVAADSRAPRDGRFIETVGTYDPLIQPMNIEIQEDRVFHWLKNGAQPTQTVRSLFRKKGIWLKWDLLKNGAEESKIAEEFAKWELLQMERAKRIEAQKVEAAKSKKKEVEEEAQEEPVNEPEIQAEAAPEETAQAEGTDSDT